MILNPLAPMQGSSGMPVLIRFPGVDMIGNLRTSGNQHVTVWTPGFIPAYVTVNRSQVYGWAAR